MKKDTGFYVLAITFLIILIGVYSNHFNNPFEFDDSHTIVNNNAIRSLKNIPHFFTDARTFSVLPANQSYRPIVTTLNAIDYWIGGKTEPTPLYYHISIFISFVFLGILLYFFLLKTFDITYTHEWNKYLALLGAGFYCLHAANAETINYIISRSDSFSTTMVVLSFVIFMYKPKWRNKLIYLIPILIGFLTKEPAIMAAPLLFAYVLLFEKKDAILKWFSSKGLKDVFASVLGMIPLFVLILLLLGISKIMTPSSFSPTMTPWSNYVLTQPYVILHYFNNFILPISLSADTDWVPVSNIYDYRVFVGVLFILILIGLAIYCSGKNMLRPISFGIIWFLLALLPTSITSLAEVMNDHRPFFAYIGLVLAFTWFVGIQLFKIKDQITSNSTIRFGLIYIFSFILSAHAYGVHQRNKVWSSSESLWHDVTIKSPKNARGLMNYGVALMTRADYQEALHYFEECKALWPNYYTIYTNLGILKSAIGKNDEAEELLKKSISLNKNAPASYHFYAKWLYSQQRLDDALRIINEGLEISLEDIENIKLRNKILSEIKNKKKQFQETEKSVLASPTPEGYLNLSLNYYKNNEFEKSIDAANMAIQLKPLYAKAYNNICAAQNALGNYDEAIKAGQEAIKIESNYQLAKNNLNFSLYAKSKVDSMQVLIKMKPSANLYTSFSFLYYNLKSFNKCIEMAQTAIKYDPKIFQAYNNICSAYNELKQWNKAIDAGEKGMKINPNYERLKNNLEISRNGKKNELMLKK